MHQKKVQRRGLMLHYPPPPAARATCPVYLIGSCESQSLFAAAIGLPDRDTRRP